MELSDLKGLGPAKQEALRNAGIGNVEDLAAIDLRKNVEVAGITEDGLKDLKQRARRLLTAEGKPVPKAPYRRNGRAPASRAPKAVVTDASPKRRPAEPDKRGFLRRFLTRRA